MRSQKALAMLACAGEQRGGGGGLSVVAPRLGGQSLQQVITVMKETRVVGAVGLEIGGLLRLRGHPRCNGIVAQPRCAQAGRVSLGADRFHPNAPSRCTSRSLLGRAGGASSLAFAIGSSRS